LPVDARPPCKHRRAGLSGSAVETWRVKRRCRGLRSMVCRRRRPGNPRSDNQPSPSVFMFRIAGPRAPALGLRQACALAPPAWTCFFFSRFYRPSQMGGPEWCSELFRVDGKVFGSSRAPAAASRPPRPRGVAAGGRAGADVLLARAPVQDRHGQVPPPKFRRRTMPARAARRARPTSTTRKRPSAAPSPPRARTPRPSASLRGGSTQNRDQTTPVAPHPARWVANELFGYLQRLVSLFQRPSPAFRAQQGPRVSAQCRRSRAGGSDSSNISSANRPPEMRESRLSASSPLRQTANAPRLSHMNEGSMWRRILPSSRPKNPRPTGIAGRSGPPHPGLSPHLVLTRTVLRRRRSTRDLVSRKPR